MRAAKHDRGNTICYLFIRQKFLPNIRLESESLENILNIVATTNLCAMRPKNAVARRTDLSFHNLVNPRPTRSVALLSHNRRNASPAAREFMKMVKEYAKAENR